MAAARVVTVNGVDVTESFLQGARLAVDCATTEGAGLAVLKDGSPSCGSGFIIRWFVFRRAHSSTGRDRRAVRRAGHPRLQRAAARGGGCLSRRARARASIVKFTGKAVQKLRALCLSFPETSERSSRGHPNFRAGKRTFARLRSRQRPSFDCIASQLDGHRPAASPEAVLRHAHAAGGNGSVCGPTGAWTGVLSRSFSSEAIASWLSSV